VRANFGPAQFARNVVFGWGSESNGGAQAIEIIC
jgi:hypothetical protein